ncbi:MAG: peptide-methionine (S)-S-oxide reductase MsrA [Methanosarcinaceae archaeon]|nr:peptide-methionine (S)-S-oxide reductase MsrA [Methanosarcinaceae archaeon]
MKDKILQTGYETATFAAGSFWRAEAIFRRVKGVIATSVGFMGGTVEYPTYKQVSTGETGHAEAVQIIFDPQVVSYEKLLELFWELHNPTEPAEEGEIQSQYRSVIFYHNEKQHEIAVISKHYQESSGRFKRKIITEIQPASRFYKAKEYHQQYYEKVSSGGKIIK